MTLEQVAPGVHRCADGIVNWYIVEDQPITTALNSLNGAFFTNDNLVAAGSIITAIPTIIVFVALQKHFVGGLTIGANKG